jgi:uncharacterized protein (TIGR03067 family)
MRRFVRLAAPLAVAILVLGAVVGRGQTSSQSDSSKDKDSEAPATLVGKWTASTVSILLDAGRRKSIPTMAVSGNKRVQLGVVVTEDKFSLKAGDKVLAGMTYTSDAKAEPCTIDLKSADGPMLGIYKFTTTPRGVKVLQIRFDDESRGRPKNFEAGTRGFDLGLSPAVPAQ